MLPFVSTLPTPVKIVPRQQKRYAPVWEFHSSTIEGLLSSCRQMSKVVTENMHIAILFDASVAVQTTAVVPSGKQVPDGGEHETVTPGQLSVTVG